MNKKLMALSLVVGLSFSQMPLQAAWLDQWIAPEKVEYFQNAAMNYVQEASKIVQENPVACAVTGSALLGLLYFGYKKYNASEKMLNTTLNEIINCISNTEYIKQEVLYKKQLIEFEYEKNDKNELLITKYDEINDQISQIFNVDDQNLLDNVKKFITSN